MTETLTTIDPKKIGRTGWNPRKRRDTKKDEELRLSIKDAGLLQPPLLRPYPPGQELNGYTHELVCGERRLDAVLALELADIPVLIKEMTDKQVKEAMLAENAARSDVHPVEEAETYHALIQEHGYEVKTVAARTGRSEAVVRQRLALLDLHPGVLAFWEENEWFTASHAAALGELALEEQGVAIVAGGDWQMADDAPYIPLCGLDDVDLADENPDWNEKPREVSCPNHEDGRCISWHVTEEISPFTTKELRAAILKMHRNLEIAPWNHGPGQPEPEGHPSCASCPHNTHATPDLFGETSAQARCRNADCYVAKVDSFFEQAADGLARKYAGKGAPSTVITSRQAVLDHFGGRASPPMEMSHSQKGRRFAVEMSYDDEVRKRVFKLTPEQREEVDLVVLANHDRRHKDDKLWLHTVARGPWDKLRKADRNAHLKKDKSATASTTDGSGDDEELDEELSVYDDPRSPYGNKFDYAIDMTLDDYRQAVGWADDDERDLILPTDDGYATIWEKERGHHTLSITLAKRGFNDPGPRTFNKDLMLLVLNGIWLAGLRKGKPTGDGLWLTSQLEEVTGKKFKNGSAVQGYLEASSTTELRRILAVWLAPTDPSDVDRYCAAYGLETATMKKAVQGKVLSRVKQVRAQYEEDLKKFLEAFPNKA